MIGRALPHVEVAVHAPDDDGVGELWISGPGVTAGYLNDPELTAERFVVDGHGRRAYRTADLVREVGAAGLEYVGRSGGYVKVNGYRVEPGEVVSALRSHPRIADAAVSVAAAPGGGDAIVGAVVARPGPPPSEIDLRKHVAQHLPTYMRPSRIMFFDRFPVLASGKLDARAVHDAVVARLGVRA